MNQLRLIIVSVLTAALLGGPGLPTFIPFVGTAVAEEMPEEELLQGKKRAQKRRKGQVSKPGVEKMKRILLVDDSKTSQGALKLLLEHHGYACEEADNGYEALGWLEQGQPVDLIVSDNQMPIKTGMEFLVQVKANPHFSTIPFIMLSGHLTEELQQQAHQAGAVAVLNKPYNLSDFLAIVAKAIETP